MIQQSMSDLHSDPVLCTGMGALELAAYRRHWRQSMQFRQQVEDATAFGRRLSRGFGALRSRSDQAPDFDLEDEADRGPADRSTDRPPDVGRIAVELQLARYFDERSDLLTEIMKGAPTIVVDVADPRALSRVSQAWQDLLFQGRRKVDITQQGFRRRQELDVLFMTVSEPPKGAVADEREKAALHGLSLGLPFFGISPLARSHLPSCLIKAASTKMDFPRIDALTVERAIRIVTGRRCGRALDCLIGTGATVEDLIIAIRFDRTPGQCIEELGRLADLKRAKADSRGLVLSQLHGLGDARGWARDSIADIHAWKQGRISWSAVSSAIALEGPPGCGKTTFASVYCAEAGLHMVGDANMAAWQSSGEGHLGHLLRAMKKSFEEARANAPACIVLDECDSVADRNSMTHSHRDYSVQVVNALLAEIDGIRGREGVVIIGCSNDLSRCDPALLRAGRLEKIVRIGYPDVAELERMFRVRLQNDLRDDDLTPLAELAIGMVGADVERIVKDARRVARGQNRLLSMSDLLGSVGDGEELDERTRRRVAAHEAAHIVVDVLRFGPDRVHAVLTRMRSRAGAVVRQPAPELEGTYADCHRRLQILLAGRVGEHMLCGSTSRGAGGRRGSDLHQATSLAASMVGSLGLAGRTPLLFLGATDEIEALLSFREVRTAANAELSKADRAVRDLLARYPTALESVANTLFERGRIDGTAVAAILASTCINDDTSTKPATKAMLA